MCWRGMIFLTFPPQAFTRRWPSIRYDYESDMIIEMSGKITLFYHIIQFPHWKLRKMLIVMIGGNLIELDNFTDF